MLNINKLQRKSMMEEKILTKMAIKMICLFID